MADSTLIVHRMADVHVIEFIDHSILEQRTIDRVERDLIQLAEESGWPRFVISFSGVSSIASSVLGMLMSVNKKVASLKGEMRLSNVDARIFEVFKLTRLDKVLKIYKTTQDALKGFGGNEK